MRSRNIAVIGASSATAGEEALAEEAGRAIAAEGWALVCGGLGGVMSAASKGARSAGGLVIGILPGYRHDEGNPHLSVALPTGLGHARNAVIAASAEGVVAVGGEHGTLSEIALALKMGKPVAALQSQWSSVPGVETVASAEEAVAFLKKRLA
ncbi:MAG: TIGR00725 family protein [Nitrospinae bacterium]|nr:TIGR00725 family protein [Nitrospinota bacterium]